MIKNKFFKNLYQSISFSLIVLVFILFLLLGFIENLNHHNNNENILLCIILGLAILFFSIGFYWIFQKVEFNNDGIKITLINKVIRNIPWDNVEDLIYTSVMKNPAYVLKIKGDKNLNLDSRKGIKKAILYYGNENIKQKVKNLLK